MDPQRNHYDWIFAFCEWATEQRESSTLALVGLGILAPLCIAAYGVSCIARQEAIFLGGRPIQIVTWNETPAICLGMAYVGIALFMHFQCVWLPSERFHAVGQIGRVVAATAVAAGFGYLAIHVFVFM